MLRRTTADCKSPRTVVVLPKYPRLTYPVYGSMMSAKYLLALFAAIWLPSALAETVKFELDLTWEKGAPNGTPRQMIFMNGQFPGPELRLNQGDDVEVQQLPCDPLPCSHPSD